MDGELIRSSTLEGIQDDVWRSRIYQLFERRLDRNLANRREVLNGVRDYLWTDKNVNLPLSYKTLLKKCQSDLTSFK